jgi:hypothetical protein
MMDKIRYKSLQKALLKQFDGDFYKDWVLNPAKEPVDVVRSIVKITLEAVGENATDCKIDGVMKYIEENL